MEIFDETGNKVPYDISRVRKTVRAVYFFLNRPYTKATTKAIEKSFNTKAIKNWCIKDCGREIPCIEDIKEKIVAFLSERLYVSKETIRPLLVQLQGVVDSISDLDVLLTFLGTKK